MPFPSSVLCYGRDPSLLATRQQLLERAGFATEIAHNQRDFERCLQEYSVDLVLLCHSLNADECAKAKQTVHELPEPTLILLLSKGVEKCSVEGVDALFDCRGGPDLLLRSIRSLINERAGTLWFKRKDDP